MALTRRQTNDNHRANRSVASNTGSGGHGGAITDGELQALKAAFESGAIGELLIGMKGGHRALTLYLPAAEDGRATPKGLSAALDHLRRAGCEQAVRVHLE